ncbi:SUMF1/EgtB/PvdO family nonheme iron enzyme [Robbsia sp. KACC 23696]|uniref:SUMF1/EgtB/PvdO family nonheme iron enzyme n=1 Tax=Robbsia sp. KACC 23696 TaxID=3149231 RepID=UPI00325C2F99
MPEDLHGADPRTVASTTEAPRFARSFVLNDRAPVHANDRGVVQQPALNAADFLAEYRAACAQTDQLFAAVHPDFLSSRPVPERHRLLFYIGHLEAFDWNLLASRALAQPPFNPEFDHLFAFGIDPVGGGLPTDVPEDWPSMQAIRQYRDTVRDRIETAIAHVDFSQSVRRLPEDIRTDAPIEGDDVHAAAGADAAAKVRQDEGDVSIATLCLVALEHRQMHAETLAYLIHQMPYAHKRAPDAAAAQGHTEPTGGARAGTSAAIQTPAAQRDDATDPGAHVGAEAPMCRIPGGVVSMGLPGSFTIAATRGASSLSAQASAAADRTHASQFGWDNEWVDPAAAQVSVPAFEIDRWMVTNGAFLRFVEAGGYDDPTWWREEDWAWRQAADVSHPAFWERDVAAPDGWRWRGMFAPLALPLSWPVYVSRAEAAAYARFVGKRLPTEAEWLRAAEGVAGLPDASMSLRPADTRDAAFTDGAAPGSAAEQASRAFHGNADFRRWDPDAVDAHPQNHSHFGVEGQFGNGWEWTADPFAPFKGFKAFPFYRGYSADFFDNQHFVMKGGSPRTAARMLRPSFRNWFQAHYPYVYAGFRCAR